MKQQPSVVSWTDQLRQEMPLTVLPELVDRVGFVPDGPLTVLDGHPRASVRELYDEGAAHSGLWEVTPGAFAAENDGFAEYMHILEGRGTVLSNDGSTLELRPGVKFIAPSGWRGRWVVAETIRKIYVIWPDRATGT
ncbi:cupin domain-containing protein [Angustibacter sp. McL0619]|uniref:cupin domain-containing protein n=1 Tax=Angustibacter sp. McL0619 TaxID=3415676 RepID=UPI003CEF7222